MNLESILYYSTHHSESIIQWLFFGILLLSALVIARSVFAKREMQTADRAHVSTAVFEDGSEIQTFLKKILDQTTKLESVKLDGLAPAAVGDMDAKLQALKKDLSAREEELAKLKASGSAPAAAASADSEKLASRIKELETKLAEYEILEDDIADLSLYKEENVRLRTEMDKLKAGGPVPSAAAPAGDDIVAEFAEAVKQPMPPGTPEAPKATGADPISEFESAVNLEKKIAGEAAAASASAEVAAPVAPTPIPTPPPVAAAAPTPPPPQPPPQPHASASAPPAPKQTAAPGEGDDLFAEFENPSPESLDTDKMMEEMAALVGMEPAKDTALNDEIDTEKMAAEATRLGKS